MKRRLLGFGLAVAMVLTLLPTATLADAGGGVNTAEEFAAALKAGGEVTLTKDITISEKMDLVVTQPVTLNLNGHTVTKSYSEINHYFMVIRDGGSLTINDTSGGKLEATGSSGYGIQLQSGGTLILNNGTLEANQEVIDVDNGGSSIKVEINGGVVKNTGYDSAINIREGAVVDITGGEITSPSSNAIFANSYGVSPQINISGGALTGGQWTVYVSQGADVTVSGDATLTTTGSTGAIHLDGSSYYPSTLTIEGGEIQGDYNAVEAEGYSAVTMTGGSIGTDRGSGIQVAEQATAEISGGRITGGGDSKTALSIRSYGNNEDADFIVTGGTFSSDVEAYIPSGAALTQTEDNNMFAVAVDSAAMEAAVASVNSVGYNTLQAAIDAAGSGDVVEVLQSHEITSAISTNKTLTIQGATDGITISNNGITGGRPALISSSGVGITLKDLTFTGGVVNVAGATGPVVVDHCTFADTTVNQSQKDGVLQVTGATAGSSLTVTNSTFRDLDLAEGSSSTEFVAIYNNGSLDSIEVTGSVFKNIAGSALSLRGSSSITITDNTFENWANGSGNDEGRAIRVDTVDVTNPVVTITENKMTSSSATESYVKITNLGNSSNVDVSRNYWDGMDPATGIVTGTTPVLEVAKDSDTVLSGDDLRSTITGEDVYYIRDTMRPQDLNIYNYIPPVPSYLITLPDPDNGTVTADRTTARQGTEVILTVTPDRGYEVGSVTVTDFFGNAVDITRNSDGTYSFVMPYSQVTVSITFAAEEPIVFTDVPEGAYYYNPVYWAVENGITDGTSETEFSPGRTVTRGEMVTFLWRAAGSPEPTTTVNPFEDVAGSAYYYDAVLWAVEQGITDGTSETEFSPSRTLTRAEAVTFLWRAADRPTAAGNGFADVDEEAYYYTADLWAVGNGVTDGTSDTTFDPAFSCTRAQAVTFLYRAQS